MAKHGGEAVRLTFQVRAALALLCDGRERYGREVVLGASLEPGTAYPLLRRLEAAGWAESRREVVDESAAGRRARVYYRLTALGLAAAAAAGAEAAWLLLRVPGTGPTETAAPRGPG